MTKRAGRITFALALAVTVLAGCTKTHEDTKPVRATPSSGTPSVRTIPFDLYTHCGIDEARIGSTYFEADPPLSDNSGNPPEGWDNPIQHGTMTLKSKTETVFTDNAGHEVKFRARPGATAFKRLCS
ncbi:hypothetical protein SMIR_41250 (plasmid) [Streptomyces mirabilis]|uniref:hypothetical protein n=1 Tax=Streptomyces mirabilis TaxID=68239 RepID=UPI001BB0B34D|nr:hypothetical protein [Streptomyces mirabilis]QUW85503.1 hypothetical protein SMIR_41250 [Streptomyces mirabilis]